jgi:hypothetical protein
MEKTSHPQFEAPSVKPTDSSAAEAKAANVSGFTTGSPEDIEWARSRASEAVALASQPDANFAPFRRLLPNHTQ